MTITALYNGTAVESARYSEKHRNDAGFAARQLASGRRQVTASKDSSSQAITNQLASTSAVLEQAKVNAKNGVAVIQVATSAYRNIQELLTQMNALAAQSNSGDSNVTSKALMDKSYQQLLTQVTNIAERTRWNGVSLLAGGSGSLAFGATVASNTATNVAASTNAFIANTVTSTGYITGTASGVTVSQTGPNFSMAFTVTNASGDTQTFQTKGFTASANGNVLFTSTTDSSNTITLRQDATVTNLASVANIKAALETTLGLTTGGTRAQFVSSSIANNTTVNGFNNTTGLSVSTNTPAGQYAISYAANSNILHLTGANLSEDIELTADGAQTVSFPVSGVSVTLASAFARNTAIGQFSFDVQPNASNEVSMVFQTGESGTSDTDTVTFGGATASVLQVSGTNVTTATDAVIAAALIDTAIKNLNSLFADLGAKQGSLEATINNLGSIIENFQAAQSVYSDVDVADALTRQTLATIRTDMANASIGKALMLNQQLLRLVQQA
jgi:flagellin